MGYCIKPGQIYRSCKPVSSEPELRHIRIKVVSKPMTIPGVWGFGKVEIVTLTSTGREVRRRRVSIGQLHDSPLTRDGRARRAGYALEQTDAR